MTSGPSEMMPPPRYLSLKAQAEAAVRAMVEEMERDEVAAYARMQADASAAVESQTESASEALEQISLLGVEGTVTNHAVLGTTPVTDGCSLLEDMERERQMWDAKVAQLERTNSTSPLVALRPLTGGVAKRATGVRDVAASTTCVASTVHASGAPSGYPDDEFITAAQTVSSVYVSDDALGGAANSYECETESHGRITAALLAAGLVPGREAAVQLAACKQIETSVCENNDSETLDIDAARRTDRGIAGVWASPSRRWAAERLRQKRERRANSRASTPLIVKEPDLALSALGLETRNAHP